MTKSWIVEQLAKDRVVESIVDNVNNSDQDRFDLVQDIYLDLLTKDDAFIQELYQSKKLKYFIVKMVTNNIKSKTSPYYYQYKKPNEKVDYYGDIYNLEGTQSEGEE